MADDPYTLNLAEALMHPGLVTYLKELAEKGAEHAKSIAPVGTRTTKHSTPGQYRDSITAEVHTSKTRVVGRIRATDFTAYWIEFGSKHNEKQAILAKTMDFLEGRA
ncbi:HK97 gp10 family phage protein [Kutzneria albida]|uniref:HK97 gp10 family phage protein n=1 Tax=Kutzneria albida DSM 43870 TaxID=1449976 RepID=W5WC48_9PSEU|nr:HK97 gp10 family phage protein [Kutzneria albida]AHH98330.1 hypothetical protein KALB_4968 [Kutzneria albida DSM 43870]